MRKSGWPFQDNATILNQKGMSLITTGTYYDESIVFRSNETQNGAIIGEFVGIGEHLKILLVSTGLPTTETWAIVLRPYTDGLKVLWQDGTQQIALKNEWTVQKGDYTYSIGTTVWYDMWPTVTQNWGTITGFTGQHPLYLTFTIQDHATGASVVRPYNNVTLKSDIPANKVQYSSDYNVRPVPGTVPL